MPAGIIPARERIVRVCPNALGKRGGFIIQETQKKQNVVIRFAGDFTQAEQGTPQYIKMAIMEAFDRCHGGDITQVFSPALLNLMKSADIFMLNNEYTYTLRGKPLPGKQWVFRARPERVENLHKMGVDLVGIANNHIYDWGEESFVDTLETLTNAGVKFVGAGNNIEEAMRAEIFEIGGRKFSFVCCTSIEKNARFSKNATENSGGVLNFTTDPEKTIEAVENAKAKSDYCFVFVHWGNEKTSVINEEQKTWGRKLIDAGADAVIGNHAHVLQGFEFYRNKPILYSLGNFWFNSFRRVTCLLEFNVHLEDLTTEIRFLPCLQKHCRTKLMEDFFSRFRTIKYMEYISVNAAIDKNGFVKAKKNSGK